ncbi:MAG: hypothetical protein ACNS60_09800 [Candidatus Cyclobacteriaceae bacterium M2_1C_046]
MTTENQGFDPQVIETYRQKMKAAGTPYLIEDSTDNSEEFVNFFFIGKYESREVIYDAVIYTLRLHHESELYEIAEHKAAQHFPSFKSIKYKEDENGDLMALDDKEEEIGLYITEVMTELEEEGEVKVQEHVEIDTNIDFGIGLNAGLNIEEVTPKVIKKFISDFNEDKLKLDDTLYSFQTTET